jgi:hypothetical protein
MKGIELPINVLIIIAVAVIVLIAIIAMFYPTFSNGSSSVTSDVAKSAACQLLVDRGCGTATTLYTYKIPVYNFDANRDGDEVNGAEDSYPAACGGTNPGNDNLARLCLCYYSITTEETCKALCGC